MNFILNNNIRKKIEEAITSNNLTAFKKIMVDEISLVDNKDELEWQIFQTAHVLFFMQPNNDKLLKYLIFEYKIGEENSLKRTRQVNQKVKTMFEQRRLSEELNNELSTNINSDKRIKI